MMPTLPKPDFINGLTPRRYLKGSISPYRRCQDIFLERFGQSIVGNIVEIGGEKKYNHARFFPAAASFRCGNISRDYDEWLDVTNMPYEDDSQDAFVCFSVLEHVYDFRKGLSEIHRTLKPGGHLLLSVPFAYPYHDEVDYWRFAASAYPLLLDGFDVRAFSHFGGRYSVVAETMQRPKGKMSWRLLPSKSIGLFVSIVGRHLDRLDDFPVGYGFHAVKL